jgi:translation initiation factor 3 subunit L
MTSAKVFEDNELPVNLEDLPNFRLKNIESDAFQYVPGQELQTAKKFITDLQTLLMKKKPEPKDRDELLNLYDFSFNKICESVFKTSFWPTPQQIEESDEDLEIDITTQTLYQELCFRHIYARLQNYNADVRTGSWENYKDLFDIILNSKDEINLPVPWIWDILDEFIYQYQTNCQWRSKVKEDDPIYAEIIHSDKDFWNLDVLQNILKSLIEKGKILKSVKQGEFSLDDFGMNLRSSHYFAYFSLVGLLRTHTLLGDFKSALQIIEPIDFKKLIIYSKAYACYISLFFYSGFALIMTGRHREAVKIFEALLSFISKYKQFYSK